jgi:hypothetical protein
MNQVSQPLLIDVTTPQGEQVLETGSVGTPERQTVANAALGIDQPATQHRCQIGFKRRAARPNSAARRLTPSALAKNDPPLLSKTDPGRL